MAQVVPLLSLGVAAGSLAYSISKGERAQRQDKRTRAEQIKAQGRQDEILRKQKFEELKKAGARQRIAGLTQKGDIGTLFDGGDFAGVPAQKTLGG